MNYIPKVILPVLLVMYLNSHAQFNKGEKFLGGVISFTDNNISSPYYSNINNKTVSILPTMGFLVSEKFAVGGTLGLATSKQTVSNTIEVYDPSTGGFITTIIDSENTSKTYSGGLFGQQYFAISDKFLFILAGNLSFSRNHTSSPIIDGSTGEVIYISTNSYALGATINPALIFFPSPSWGISAHIGSLGYTYGYSLSQEKSTNSFNFNYGSLSLGLAYYFRKP